MTNIPTQADILKWIRTHPEKSSKRDIAKAFGIKGAARIDLKQTLRELEAEGHISQKRRKFNDPNTLPPVSVLQLLGPDEQGDMFAVPLEWEGTGTLPKILMQMRPGEPVTDPAARPASASAFEMRFWMSLRLIFGPPCQARRKQQQWAKEKGQTERPAPIFTVCRST